MNREGVAAVPSGFGGFKCPCTTAFLSKTHGVGLGLVDKSIKGGGDSREYRRQIGLTRHFSVPPSLHPITRTRPIQTGDPYRVLYQHDQPGD